jgi:LmbE family N-acetylglucosaminyl deacetylase
MAHPDDAEFLCTGTLIRLADLGWQIHIATATRGDCGTMTHSAEEISAIRSREAQDAAATIGAIWHTLDEKDGKVCYDKPTLDKAYALFRRFAPSLVFTHALSDYMIDHEMVSLICRSVSFLYGAPNVSREPLIERSGVPYLYYCDPIEGTDPFGNPVNPPILVDVTAQMPRKIEMLSRHASQREWLRAHHGMDEYIAAMKRLGSQRGQILSVDYAEAFLQHRGHAYPHDDILKTL